MDEWVENMVMHNKLKRNWQNYVVAYWMGIPGTDGRHEDPQNSLDPGQVLSRVHAEY
jgi:hypothetical protein